MKKRDADLDRLLRSAASVPEHDEPELPFGFDTRVVASWREGKGTNGVAELTPFLRRIEVIAIAVVLLTGVGVYRQFNENLAQVTAQTNEYTIADSAIQTEFSR